MYTSKAVKLASFVVRIERSGLGVEWCESPRKVLK
jgi:hypothetical protein